jgi:hypothetical protein
VDRQCSSCGGFCKKSGCERENIKPKEWVGLTDDEVAELRLKTFDAIATNYEVYRAIEAKLKEKNA